MDSRARTIIIIAVLLLTIPLVLLLQRGGDETAAALRRGADSIDRLFTDAYHVPRPPSVSPTGRARDDFARASNGEQGAIS